MTLALLSAASGKPLRGDLAMKGEVTLRGNVLPIGGLNEKLLAAKRQGYTTIFVPAENETDVKELDKGITDGLDIVFVKHIDDAVDIAFDLKARKKTSKKKRVPRRAAPRKRAK